MKNFNEYPRKTSSSGRKRVTKAFQTALCSKSPIICFLEIGKETFKKFWVTTNMENMEKLEKSGNFKNCQNLRENSG